MKGSVWLLLSGEPPAPGESQGQTGSLAADIDGDGKRYRVPDILVMKPPFRQTHRVGLDARLLIVEILESFETPAGVLPFPNRELLARLDDESGEPSA